jgi:hypothetical protein
MADDRMRRHWSAEFAELGPGGVRNSMTFGHWPADKRAYAREWLHHRDIADWEKQAPRGGGSAGLARLRMNRKAWGVISGLMFGGYALFRVLRTLKLGL